MKLIITNSAKTRFREIHEFYKKEGKGKTGRKIRATIQKRALILIEPRLEHLEEGHRYLLVGNHKLIYRIIGQAVYVTDIFDTRQDPDKMKP